jgi:hypothetical protein
VVTPTPNSKSDKVIYKIGGNYNEKAQTNEIYHPSIEPVPNETSNVVPSIEIVPNETSNVVPSIEIVPNETSNVLPSIETVPTIRDSRIAAPISDSPIPNEINLAKTPSPISKREALLGPFGVNFEDNYYNKSNSFYLDMPGYRDVINLIGVGFIEKTNYMECGQRAAYLEYYLRKHGINASIILDEDFFGEGRGHSWVMVTLQTNEIMYIDASGATDLDVKGAHIKMDNRYKYLPNDKSMHKFSKIGQALLFYGNKEGNIDLTFDWWNTGWGRSILERELNYE